MDIMIIKNRLFLITVSGTIDEADWPIFYVFQLQKKIISVSVKHNVILKDFRGLCEKMIFRSSMYLQ